MMMKIHTCSGGDDVLHPLCGGGGGIEPNNNNNNYYNKFI
jgi:hypothetical protein